MKKSDFDDMDRRNPWDWTVRICPIHGMAYAGVCAWCAMDRVAIAKPEPGRIH